MSIWCHGSPVKPIRLDPGFDFLSLVRASIEARPDVTVEQGVGIDADAADPPPHPHEIPPLTRLIPPHLENGLFPYRIPSSQALAAKKPGQSKRKHAHRARNREREAVVGATESTAPVSSHSPQVPAPIIQPRQRLENSKRAQKRRAASSAPYNASKRTLTNALSHGTAVYVDRDASSFAAARGAHTAKKGTQAELGSEKEKRAEYSLAHLLSLGFRHVQWDGITPHPLLDANERIVGVLAGQPCAGYGEALAVAFQEMMKAGKAAGLGAEDPGGPHSRGGFPAYNIGVTGGNGNGFPVALRGNGMGDILRRLMGHKAVARMAQYQNAAFSLWAPRLYDHYNATLKKMHVKLPHLPENFPGGVFAAAAFNFGGNVWTFKHRDFLNWSFGWCAITALGEFDATRSAQLILWELKLVVDFPPGSTVLIPSAVITHSNTPVAEGDTRTSFTQYTAGGIFRWVENGCMTETEPQAQDPRCYDEMVAGKDSAYLERIRLYSTVEELMDKLNTAI